MGKRSSSRGGDDSRGQSASRRSSGEQGGKKEQGSISLLVRNLPHDDCSFDVLAAFQKFGRIRDFYIPKDYHSGEPRGFAFVEFCDSRDASEAQRRMNHKMLCGREINVVPASGKRKRPDGMPRGLGVRGHSDYNGRHLSRHGRPRSRSHSRSPRRDGRDRSRSHSPAPRRRGDYSASPKRREECQTKSSGQSKEHDKGKKEPCTRDRSDRHDADNVSNGRQGTPDCSAAPKRTEEYQTKIPRQAKKHDEDKRHRSYTPADRNDCREAHNGHNERDDYSTSPKRKAKSPRLSKEYDKDTKQRSYSRDDGNNCCDADTGLKERRATTDGEGSCPHQSSPRPSSGSHLRRRDDYSASPKGKEEFQEQSPRHSKEYDTCKKLRSDTLDNRNDCRNADHSHNEIQDDHPTSPKIKEERQAKSSGESKEYDKDTKRRSYAPHDRNDRRDADNGSKDSNVHVERKPVTPDGEGSHAGWRSPGPSTRSSSRRQDDYSASAKRKEGLRAKSQKQSNEHEDKERRSYTPDDRNDRCDADNCNKKRHASPDNGSPKRTEEPRQAKSQSQSKEHDNDKKQRSYTREDRKDRCNADNGSKERDDYSASGNKTEECGEDFPRQSKEHDENKKRGSFTPGDRNGHHDTDNGSKERDDNSAFRKRTEDHRAKSLTQSKEHENEKKRGSYTHDNRKDHCDADNGCRERRDEYLASRNRKEERRVKSPRQSKEHDDNKKRGSFTPDDRNDHHDSDNGSKKTNVVYNPMSQEGEMTTQLPEIEWRTTVQNHRDNQKNMRTRRRGDPILMTIERTTVMLIMVPESEMNTRVPEIERRSAGQNHRDSRRNMMIIRRGDHLLLMIEMTTTVLIMVQKSEMTTQLPEIEWRTTVQNHRDSQKNMRTIRRGDRIPVTIERTAVMLIMALESEMATQLLEGEWRTTVQTHQDNQKNTRVIIRGDHILMTIERTAMMLIMVPESEMTTQLPERERKNAGKNHRDSQRNMMRIRRGDHMRLMIEMTVMMLIMVAMRSWQHLMARVPSPVPAGGHRGHLLAQGTRLMAAAATDGNHGIIGIRACTLPWACNADCCCTYLC